MSTFSLSRPGKEKPRSSPIKFIGANTVHWRNPGQGRRADSHAGPAARRIKKTENVSFSGRSARRIRPARWRVPHTGRAGIRMRAYPTRPNLLPSGLYRRLRSTRMTSPRICRASDLVRRAARGLVPRSRDPTTGRELRRLPLTLPRRSLYCKRCALLNISQNGAAFYMINVIIPRAACMNERKTYSCTRIKDLPSALLPPLTNIRNSQDLTWSIYPLADCGMPTVFQDPHAA